MSGSVVAFLSAQRQELAGELARLLRENLPFYRSLPEDRLGAATAVVMNIFLDQVLPAWDPEPLVSHSAATIQVRIRQGMSFEDGVGVTTYLRRALLSAVVARLDAQLEDTPRFLLFLDECCAMTIKVIARIYAEALEKAHAEIGESEARYREIVECSPDGVTVHREGIFLYLNPAATRMLGREAKVLVGTEVIGIFPPECRDDVIARMRAAASMREVGTPAEYVMMRADGARFDVELVGAWVMFEGQPARQVVFRDITDRKQAAEVMRRAAVQDEIILAQEARLRELMMPLIPVSDGVVVMPLVGLVDAARAVQMRQVLLEGIATASAKVAILDVTGVPAVDASAAAALLGAVSAARLLGAEVVLTGITPSAARTLVELGADFGGVVTRATLKDGIGHALTRETRR